MKREYQVKFRLSKEEHDLLEKRYIESHVRTKSKFLRNMALNGYIIHVEQKDLQQLVYEINQIGKNINQVAHAINARDQFVYQTDMDKLNEAMDDINRLIRKRLKENIMAMPK